MKRDDITSLFPEATQEQIKAIMKINGDDINNAKKGMDDIKSQFEEAQATINQLTADSAGFAEERTKFEAISKELTELKAATAIRDMREKVSKETGVPASLLQGDTEESCKVQADNILAFAKPASYPSVRDGGETPVKAKTDTRTQFAEWFHNQN